MKKRDNTCAANDTRQISVKERLTVVGMENLINDVINNPDWKPGDSLILDFRQVDGAHLTFNEINSIAAKFKIFKNFIGKGRMAIVATNSLGYGLSRMFQLLTMTEVYMTIEIFECIDEAEHWIKTGNLLPEQNEGYIVFDKANS